MMLNENVHTDSIAFNPYMPLRPHGLLSCMRKPIGIKRISKFDDEPITDVKRRYHRSLPPILEWFNNPGSRRGFNSLFEIIHIHSHVPLSIPSMISLFDYMSVSYYESIPAGYGTNVNIV